MAVANGEFGSRSTHSQRTCDYVLVSAERSVIVYLKIGDIHLYGPCRGWCQATGSEKGSIFSRTPQVCRPREQPIGPPRSVPGGLIRHVPSPMAQVSSGQVGFVICRYEPMKGKGAPSLNIFSSPANHQQIQGRCLLASHSFPFALSF